jgi:glucose-1-phosphate thymidylyltransferase
MMANGKVFKTGSVDEWMDCGNKEVTVETNSRMLGFLHQDGAPLVSSIGARKLDYYSTLLYW